MTGGDSLTNAHHTAKDAFTETQHAGARSPTVTPQQITSAIGPWRIADNNPLEIEPSDAHVRRLIPDSHGGAQEGVEYRWAEGEGRKVRLRIHSPDGTTPPDSNAASSHVYRIQIGKRYQDVEGNLFHSNVHNPLSPYYDPSAANTTHIPWPDQFPRPY
ncbi:polymorphic toxin type 30 domain-containing protein [Frankia sp. Cppng1_Ct_nod]|uniref:polymorphic toxin type 30 domain-containing protein n=1 Tax=Frankia sp. Cppng1_Ct_nod TaxID=2897162 RepID=UPI0032E9E9F0